MSSFADPAGQYPPASNRGPSGVDDEDDETDGQEYNNSYGGQQPRGGYDTQQVLSHAGADEEDEEPQGFVANAMQHVQDNSHRAQNEQLDDHSLATYGPMITNALSSASSNSGLDVNSLVSGGLGGGGGGGNQLMGMVMKEAGNAFSGGSGEEKQNFMNGAAMTTAKLMAQGQLSSFSGGSNSGGLGSGMLGVGETLLKNRFG